MADGEPFKSPKKTPAPERRSSGAPSGGPRPISERYSPSSNVKQIPSYIADTISGGQVKTASFRQMKVGLILQITKDGAMNFSEAEQIYYRWIQIHWETYGVYMWGSEVGDKPPTVGTVEFTRYELRVANEYFQNMMHNSGANY